MSNRRPSPAPPHTSAHALLASVIVAGAFSSWILVVVGGWHYYGTPLATRGYDEAHAFLRPSGPGGQTFGVAGTLLLCMPFLYMLRKRLGIMRHAGGLRGWLDVHIFCGLVGPVLITFHTSFKFNGVISVAYWSMVLVMLSGFVGRYLYARIPKTIRGVEMTHADIDAHLDSLRRDLELVMPAASRDVMMGLEAAFEGDAPPRSMADRLFCPLHLRRRLRAFGELLRGSGVEAAQAAHAVALLAERASLTRRLAHLHRTKRAFDLWHVFHLPLVVLLVAIVTLHVALVLYMGYVPFRW